MFNTLKTFFFGESEENKNMFTIKQNNNGFFIADRFGNLAEGTSFYSRKRDAARGATRRGLSLA